MNSLDHATLAAILIEIASVGSNDLNIALELLISDLDCAKPLSTLYSALDTVATTLRQNSSLARKYYEFAIVERLATCLGSSDPLTVQKSCYVLRELLLSEQDKGLIQDYLRALHDSGVIQSIMRLVLSSGPAQASAFFLLAHVIANSSSELCACWLGCGVLQILSSTLQGLSEHVGSRDPTSLLLVVLGMSVLASLLKHPQAIGTAHQCGVVDVVYIYITATQPVVSEHAFAVLVNICACSDTRIKRQMVDFGCLEMVLKGISNASLGGLRNCASVLVNLTNIGPARSLMDANISAVIQTAIYEQNVIKSVVTLLDVPDVRTKLSALKIVTNILCLKDSGYNFIGQIEKYGLLYKVLELHHVLLQDVSEVYKRFPELKVEPVLCSELKTQILNLIGLIAESTINGDMRSSVACSGFVGLLEKELEHCIGFDSSLLTKCLACLCIISNTNDPIARSQIVSHKPRLTQLLDFVDGAQSPQAVVLKQILELS